METELIQTTPIHLCGGQYHSCGQTHAQYLSPKGTIWKASSIGDEGVHVWNQNAWGSIYTDVIPVHIFVKEWKQYHS